MWGLGTWYILPLVWFTISNGYTPFDDHVVYVCFLYLYGMGLFMYLQCWESYQWNQMEGFIKMHLCLIDGHGLQSLFMSMATHGVVLYIN